jgi:large subunit ribosomal protein L4
MELDIYTIDGKKGKKVKVPFAVQHDVDLEHVYYLVDKYQKAFVREGNQSTKTRSEVRGGGRKPYKQKGTGRARQGTIRTPLKAGGGVIFGPKPRSFKIKLNKQVFKTAFQSAFFERKDNCIVLGDTEKDLKTKDFSKLLATLKRASDTEKVLVITKYDEDNVIQACRNIKGLTVCDPSFIPLQELLSGKLVVLSEKALAQMEEVYTK